MTINNHWRLQAQQGLFLDVRVTADLFESITPIAWITFPRSTVGNIPSNSVYPTNRSPLESLLDQYFVIEQYPARAEAMQQMALDFGAAVDRIGRIDDSCRFIGSALPDDDQSWEAKHLATWLADSPAPLPTIVADCNLILRVNPRAEMRHIFQSAHAEVLANIATPNLRLNSATSWLVTDKQGIDIAPTIESIDHLRYSVSELEDIDRDEDFFEAMATPKALSDSLSQIFDGMRYLPYSDVEIANVMATYICMAIGGGCEAISELFGPTATVEMSAAGMGTRCFIGERGISQAIRNDWPLLVRSESRNEMTRDNPRMILGALANPRKIFEFNQFKTLFAEQIIASQAFCRAASQDVVYEAGRRRCA